VQVSDAAEMFKGLDTENKTFTLMHCCNKLKGEDKWMAERKRKAKQQASKNKKKQKINVCIISECTRTSDEINLGRMSAHQPSNLETSFGARLLDLDK